MKLLASIFLLILTFPAIGQGNTGNSNLQKEQNEVHTETQENPFEVVQYSIIVNGNLEVNDTSFCSLPLTKWKTITLKLKLDNSKYAKFTQGTLVWSGYEDIRMKNVRFSNGNTIILSGNRDRDADVDALIITQLKAEFNDTSIAGNTFSVPGKVIKFENETKKMLSDSLENILDSLEVSESKRFDLDSFTASGKFRPERKTKFRVGSTPHELVRIATRILKNENLHGMTGHWVI